MFSLLGKKEVIGTTLWLAPVGLSIMGYLQWTPYRAIVVMIVIIIVASVLVSIGGIVRFFVNYLTGPRMPLG
ncbi:MAG: hypothetical protein AB1352_01390 [Patescibacteria group bacterium]